MPVQKAIAQIGLANQTAKGSIAATATFSHGVSGGKLLSADVKQDALDVTAAARVAYNVARESVINGVDLKGPAYSKALGLYLLGGLGTDVCATGTPNIHTYATANLLPYLTLFQKLGGITTAVKDCKIDELSLSWDGRKPVELGVKATGTNLSYPASGFPATTDETGSEAFLIPVGGTFQYDLDGAILGTCRVAKGELALKNNTDPVELSATIEPDDVEEGLQEHSVKLTVVPDDLLDFRTCVTGSPTGTSAAGTPPIGSFSLLFKENGSATGQLLVTASKVAFGCDFPEAEPKGGAVQIELAGIPVGGPSPVVYALSNAQASY